MSFGTSQVVGVVELDRPTSPQFEHPLSPPRPAKRSPHTSTAIAQIVAASDDEVITADVRQLKRELRAELAFVLARLSKSLHKDA